MSSTLSLSRILRPRAQKAVTMNNMVRIWLGQNTIYLLLKDKQQFAQGQKKLRMSRQSLKFYAVQKLFSGRQSITLHQLMSSWPSWPMSMSRHKSHWLIFNNITNKRKQHVGVSKNRGTPKSSILLGVSIINHPFWDTTIFGNTHVNFTHQKQILNSLFFPPCFANWKWKP